MITDNKNKLSFCLYSELILILFQYYLLIETFGREIVESKRSDRSNKMFFVHKICSERMAVDSFGFLIFFVQGNKN